MIRIVPLMLVGLGGAADGVIQRNDVQAGRANPDGSAVEGQFPFSTIFEALLAVGGAGLDLMRAVSPDITEPLMHSGVTLLGVRAGKFVSQQVLVPPAPMRAGAYAVPYYGGNGAAFAPAFGAAPALVPSESRQFVLG